MQLFLFLFDDFDSVYKQFKPSIDTNIVISAALASPRPLLPSAHSAASTYHIAERTGAHAIALGVCEVAIGGATSYRGCSRPGATAIQYDARLGGTGTATRMPNSAALQVHFLAIAKGIAALGAARTGWMEVMVVARLQHLAADETIAVGALHPEALLVALLAIRNRILAHVLPVEHRIAGLATEAPHMPLPIERNQCLPLLQQLTAAGTIIGIIVLLQMRLVRQHATGDILMRRRSCGTLRGRSGRTGGLPSRRCGSAAASSSTSICCATGNTLLTEHLLASVGHLAARLEGLLALGAREALLVIRLAHRTDHFALHILRTGGAFRAIQTLVVRYAVVGAILCEESAGGQ